MRIHQLEQSGVIIETGSGFRLAIDIASFTPLEKLDDIKPVDAMIVSHIHGDHFSISHIKKLAPKALYLNQECIDALGEESISSDVKKVTVGDSLKIGDIEALFFDVDHGPNATLKPKENFGFLIKIDGQTIYFAGDMYYPSGIEVNNLEVDIALLPVGGHYTFGPTEAMDFARQFKSIEQILPMHFAINPPAQAKFLQLLEEENLPVNR